MVEIVPPSRTKKKSEVNGVALKSRYYTPAEAFIPTASSPKTTHYPIPVTNSVVSNNNNNHETNKPTDTLSNRTELDGFYMLETAGMSFPEELQQIVISDRKLRTVVEEDMTYFTELLFVDVSENHLPFESFGAMPNLRELRITCNQISSISDELYGFDQLMYLDISYNVLTLDSIYALAALPLLKELDLSGNNLRSLPPDMSAFRSLEKLIMQYNKFDNNDLFTTVGSIPNLRYLDVSHNYFSKFPKECNEDGNLRLLETMDISFNYFAYEESIEPVIYLPRLLTVMLYGNPVLGPTGEDPGFIYIEDTIDKAAAVRDAMKSSTPDIEFITEVPRRRILKKGQPLGRLALYRDFSIVQVDTKISTKSNREWRQQGTKTLFAEAMAHRKQAALLPNSNSAAVLQPDLTFITGSIAVNNIHHTQSGKNIAVGMSALNEADRDAIADEVMKKVASEMGLINPRDIQLLEEYATLPPTVAAMELQRAMMQSEEDEEEIDFMQGYDSPNLPSTPGDGLGGFAEFGDFFGKVSNNNPKDFVPSHLFSTNMAEQGLPATLTAQPVALRTAMKALQRALDQPLTNYDEVPSKWSSQNHEITRHTNSSKLRQLPRIPLVGAGGAGEKEADDKLDMRAHRYGSNGLPEPTSFKTIRKENRDKTLRQIEQVLDKLNENTLQLTNTDALDTIQEEVAARVSHTTDILGDYYDEGQGTNDANSATNPYALAGLADNRKVYKVNVQRNLEQPSAASMKQSMDRMKNFAKPNPGVKQLMSMVDEIVQEFNS